MNGQRRAARVKSLASAPPVGMVSPGPIVSRLPIIFLASGACLVLQDTLNTIFGIQGPSTILLLLIVAAQLVTSSSRSPNHQASITAARVGMYFLSAFAVLAVAGLFIHGTTGEGIQNVAVWALFPLTITLALRLSTISRWMQLQKMWVAAACISSLIYIAQSLTDAASSGIRVYSDRGAGWIGLLGLTVLIPRLVVNRTSWWPVMLVFTSIVLSLSRTPIFAATVFLLIALSLRPRHQVSPTFARVATRFLAFVIMFVVAAKVLLSNLPALASRFEGGDNAGFAGVQFNTSGRTVLWELTWHNAMTQPFGGNGPGSAQIFITERFGGHIAHPHNEFLRIFHDLGVVGFLLWMAGISLLLIAVVRSCRGEATSEGARIAHLSALLGLATILAGSATDNVTITVFLILPLGTLLGVSLAYAADARRELRVNGRYPFRAQRNPTRIQ